MVDWLGLLGMLLIFVKFLPVARPEGCKPAVAAHLNISLICMTARIIIMLVPVNKHRLAE